MCRWFAYISDSEPCLLEDVLVRPAHSITKQVNDHYLPKLFHHEADVSDAAQRADIKARNIFFNDDGTGVGYYSYTREEYGEAVGPRPVLFKTTMPPVNCSNFQTICSHTSTLAVFCHVRMATSSVHEFNNHPFAFGRHIFMHNGSIENFTDIRRDMCALMSPKAFANVQGSTDSEHMAALYMTYLGEDWEKSYPVEEMKSALDKAIGTVLRIQRKLIPKEKQGASSLNLCTTDGEQLLAVRFRNHPTEQPPSLYISTTAGITLNRKYPGHPDSKEAEMNADVGDGFKGAKMKNTEDHGNHVIIASEPTTYKPEEWDLIGKNEAVMVDNKMKVTKVPVNANAETDM